ncbi:SAV_915 family protein [Streptomyces albidoflavus]|uniref:SAV_915 family protein n=1 Tax=Streptomyces albidoflavus TaxID=1886 RepID=UPI00331B9779
MDSAQPKSLEDAPDVLVVPTKEAGSGGTTLVTLAFSTVAALVDAMGGEQPWVAIPSDKLEGALEGSGAQVVLLDPQP